MKEERVIGNNIQVLLKNANKKKKEMASSLGYSDEDIIRICEGRLYLSTDELDDIADYFGISLDDLCEQRPVEEYEEAGCIHYNHHFKEQSNLDKIMDLFDLICDIEEAL